MTSKERLRDRIEGSSEFLGEIKAGYLEDPVFSKVLSAPDAFPQFRVENGLIFAPEDSFQWFSDRSLCSLPIVHILTQV